jgi:hypothetical protein
MLGQYEKSVAVARDAERLMPGTMSSYGNLSGSNIALGRLEDSRLVLQQEAAHVPDNWNMHQDLYLLAFLQNDQSGMEEQALWAAGKPGVEDFFLRLQAQTETYYGRLRHAHALLARAVKLAAQAGVPERGAEWKSSEALNAAKVGKTTQA